MKFQIDFYRNPLLIMRVGVYLLTENLLKKNKEAITGMKDA